MPQTDVKMIFIVLYMLVYCVDVFCWAPPDVGIPGLIPLAARLQELSIEEPASVHAGLNHRDYD